MPRALLSEEADKEEQEDRERLREVRDKLRALLDRRQLQYEEVRRLTDEQERLYDARQPGEREVERIHQEYRDLGHALADGRRYRDAARTKLDEAMSALREFRARSPRGEPLRPETIRRQIADLEHAQQTRTLTIAEENALIKQLRQLVKVADEADQHQRVHEERRKQLGALEAALTERRNELGQVNAELARLKVERDSRMQSIRGRLEGAGKLVADIREKARARGAALDRLRALSVQVDELGREADRLERNSRDRRAEARQAISEYHRSVRGPGGEKAGEQQVADRQLEELLKRGRVTLRG
ncbi:MAG: hypothetical protein L3J95_06310 [Thermoplasmata archaeon]|nr:hypothetical protein [Thermoplasmata archaeon]MCI4360007.1 hypothetical protein [Thermoplasmata archaeon]